MLGAGNIGLGDQLWCRSAPPTSIVAGILEGRVVTNLAEACARARAASCTVVWPTMTPAYSTAAGHFVASLLGATTAKHCSCRYRRSGRYSAKLCLPSPGREVFDWAWPPKEPTLNSITGAQRHDRWTLAKQIFSNGAVQFERGRILEPQREGIELAKAQSVYQRKLTGEDVQACRVGSAWESRWPRQPDATRSLGRLSTTQSKEREPALPIPEELSVSTY